MNMVRTFARERGVNEHFAALSDDELSQRAINKINNDAYSIRLGHYAVNLKKWLEVFPKERTLVINERALGEEKVWRRIFDHLGLRNEAGYTSSPLGSCPIR